jgi:hypothetical protein
LLVSTPNAAPYFARAFASACETFAVCTSTSSRS